MMQANDMLPRPVLWNSFRVSPQILQLCSKIEELDLAAPEPDAA